MAPVDFIEMGRDVLDQMPKTVQARAMELLYAIPCAETEVEALELRQRFARAFRRTYPEAVAILEKDWERMVAFFDLPKEHWKHLRTINSVRLAWPAPLTRSVFAIVRGGGHPWDTSRRSRLARRGVRPMKNGTRADPTLVPVLAGVSAAPLSGSRASSNSCASCRR